MRTEMTKVEFDQFIWQLKSFFSNFFLDEFNFFFYNQQWLNSLESKKCQKISLS